MICLAFAGSLPPLDALRYASSMNWKAASRIDTSFTGGADKVSLSKFCVPCRDVRASGGGTQE